MRWGHDSAMHSMLMSTDSRSPMVGEPREVVVSVERPAHVRAEVAQVVQGGAAEGREAGPGGGRGAPEREVPTYGRNMTCESPWTVTTVWRNRTV